MDDASGYTTLRTHSISDLEVYYNSWGQSKWLVWKCDLGKGSVLSLLGTVFVTRVFNLNSILGVCVMLTSLMTLICIVPDGYVRIFSLCNFVLKSRNNSLRSQQQQICEIYKYLWEKKSVIIQAFFLIFFF